MNAVENSAINELYEKYLKLPKIQQQLQHPQIKYTFGNSKGNANWADNICNELSIIITDKARQSIIGC
ncbi:hypothetical protein [Arsenophonus endosymbiont of Aleurodicus floccissimus]|uniref:hypothetical protein n=1 Tax=Arsenophonus endosymbiont of Aleurodicus floccissimus TaxID=2152761 RepID=UPI0016036D49|nr:hypothetical protein [Arsenophonus endosymbiont of Aleurodicus floccissimus]